MPTSSVALKVVLARLDARDGRCVACRVRRREKKGPSGDERRDLCHACRVGGAKGASCDECGFVPLHPSQLDVHHVDGVHGNDGAENRRTLCANCHRLVTFLQSVGIFWSDVERVAFAGALNSYHLV